MHIGNQVGTHQKHNLCLPHNHPRLKIDIWSVTTKTHDGVKQLIITNNKEQESKSLDLSLGGKLEYF